MYTSRSPLKEGKSNVKRHVPIIYGNMSFSLGKKAVDKASHRWICYVRGTNNEDLSYLIKKVEFVLHPSFLNPLRVVTCPPYELHETGWGEFEITIKIYFVEEYENPIEITHLLKLYHSQPNAQQSTKKPLVFEFYDEIVFLNPSERFIQILNTPPQILYNKSTFTASIIKEEDTPTKDTDKELNIDFSQERNLQEYSNFFTKFDDKYHKMLLEDAFGYIQSEVNNLKEKINKTDEIIGKLQSELDR